MGVCVQITRVAVAALVLAAGMAVTSTALAAGQSEPDIVAVTGAGSLVVLNPATGATTRTLVAAGVGSTGIAVSPSGKTVYFDRGCEIYSVPAAGGSPVAITAGVDPAISRDGTTLALVRGPYKACVQGTASPESDFSVVVRDLATGSQRSYPAPPDVPADLPYPIERVSWSPGGGELAVSIGQVQENEGEGLVLINPATSRYYIPASYNQVALAPGQVKVTAGPYASDSYYASAAFLPDGNLFVVRNCCAGEPPAHPLSTAFWIITPSGHEVKRVAPGSPQRIDSSLGADPSGRWLMYLSSPDDDNGPGKLFISHNGTAGVLLTSDLYAAAWL
jgi:hypothetical protein